MKRVTRVAIGLAVIEGCVRWAFVTLEVLMEVLVYGAGVIGTLYAARLQSGGHRVTVLARGQRLEDVRRYGLVLEDVLTGFRSSTRVAATDHLGSEDRYDLALIIVRRNQLSSIMPQLAANHRVPTLLFMLNNPAGSAELSRVLGQNRVLLGFPGAGGTRDGHVVHYAMIPQQPTMLGEPGGKRTPSLHGVARALRTSGLRVRLARNMDAWLKAHAFFVTAVTGAIYLAGGDSRRLAGEDAVLALMADGVREGFAAMHTLGLPVMPFALKVLFSWLPRNFATRYWRRYFASEMGDYVFARHARIAFEEMQRLADDCRTLLDQSRVEAPALQQLYAAIDRFGERDRPDGSD
jgi:2-dehydropantoate 2-reductase